jgi:hypothetical protein
MTDRGNQSLGDLRTATDQAVDCFELPQTDDVVRDGLAAIGQDRTRLSRPRSGDGHAPARRR